VTGTLILAEQLRWILADPAAQPLKEKRRRVGNRHSSTASDAAEGGREEA
jgi:hypothetical protein